MPGTARLAAIAVAWGVLCTPGALSAQETSDADAPGSPVDAPDEGEDAPLPDVPTPPDVTSGGAEQLERPGPAGRERRVAVIMLAASGVDSETADSLTELVIAAIAARGEVSIVGKEEFQARLGQGDARSLECVSSTACLGRVGVELGVDELVAGSVGRRGDRWVFNVNRIDIRTGNLAARAFREVEGDVGTLADALQDAVPSLYEVVSQTSTLLVSATVIGAEVTVDGMLVGVYRGEPVHLSDVSPGRHEVVVGASGFYDWSRTLTVAEGTTLQVEASLEELDEPSSGGVSAVFWIGGVATVAAAASFTWFGISSQQDPDPDHTRAEALDFVDARERDADIANISAIAIAVGAVTTLVGLAVSDFETENLDVAVGPTTTGAVVRLGGRL